MTANQTDSIVLPDGNVWQVLAEQRWSHPHRGERHRDGMDYVALPARRGRRRGLLVRRHHGVVMELEQQLDRSWRVVETRPREPYAEGAARTDAHQTLGSAGRVITGVAVSPDGCSLFVDIDRPALRRSYLVAVRRVDGRPVTPLPTPGPGLMQQCA